MDQKRFHMAHGLLVLVDSPLDPDHVIADGVSWNGRDESTSEDISEKP